MRYGFTLVELIVTITLIGTLGSVTGLAFASLRPPEQSVALREIERARSDAIRKGRPVVVHHDARSVRFLPDGSSSGGWLLVDGVWFAVSPLTGEISVLR